MKWHIDELALVVARQLFDFDKSSTKMGVSVIRFIAFATLIIVVLNAEPIAKPQWSGDSPDVYRAYPSSGCSYGGAPRDNSYYGNPYYDYEPYGRQYAPSVYNTRPISYPSTYSPSHPPNCGCPRYQFSSFGNRDFDVDNDRFDYNDRFNYNDRFVNNDRYATNERFASNDRFANSERIPYNDRYAGYSGYPTSSNNDRSYEKYMDRYAKYLNYPGCGSPQSQRSYAPYSSYAPYPPYPTTKYTTFTYTPITFMNGTTNLGSKGAFVTNTMTNQGRFDNAKLGNATISNKLF